MLSWVVLNFILVIYSNATQLTYSLIGLLAMVRRVIKMVLGADVILCMAEPDVLKKIFYPQNGENRPSPGFFECIGKFSFFSQFFTFLSIWSIMKVYITVIAVCLNKFHIRGNSGSWNMAQNALGQSDCRIFQSIAEL